ncbi:MAG TPA: FAD-binding oxidoreductase [Clostridiaceae bacterium]|nr:FAD-binding oxidoreductase [Clostridiaceae bacterium]
MDILRQIIKDRNRVVLEGIEDKYRSDSLGRLVGHPDALVFPSSSEEVSSIMRHAYAQGIPVTPRGAGTNLSGSTVPSRGGIVLDLSRMNQILELDRENSIITVEPGVLLCDLQAYVEERGFFYPPDPGEKLSTIGGNIATNAGGMRAVKYGVTRDYVRGLEVVWPNGDISNLGGKVVKDSSGLSLKHLLIGSEGTLGIITKCTLKLIPKPAFSLSVLIPFASLREGIDNVLKVIQENANPTAVEFVERSVIALGEDFLGLQFPCPDADSYILLTFDGSSESEIRSSIEKVRRVSLENHALGFLLLEDREVAENVWKIRGALVKAVESISEQEPMDIVVPISRIAAYIAYVNALQAETGVRMISFGHAGDGNVHICVMREQMDDETWEKKLDHVVTLLYDKSLELEGLPSGEHCIGITKKDHFERVTYPVNISLMRSVKLAFDDRNILNAGKIFTSLS